MPKLIKSRPVIFAGRRRLSVKEKFAWWSFWTAPLLMLNGCALLPKSCREYKPPFTVYKTEEGGVPITYVSFSPSNATSVYHADRWRIMASKSIELLSGDVIMRQGQTTILDRDHPRYDIPPDTEELQVEVQVRGSARFRITAKPKTKVDPSSKSTSNAKLSIGDEVILPSLGRVKLIVSPAFPEKNQVYITIPSIAPGHCYQITIGKALITKISKIEWVHGYIEASQNGRGILSVDTKTAQPDSLYNVTLSATSDMKILVTANSPSDVSTFGSGWGEQVGTDQADTSTPHQHDGTGLP